MDKIIGIGRNHNFFCFYNVKECIAFQVAILFPQKDDAKLVDFLNIYIDSI